MPTTPARRSTYAIKEMRALPQAAESAALAAARPLVIKREALSRRATRGAPPVVSHTSPALAPLMAEAASHAEPARTFVRLGGAARRLPGRRLCARISRPLKPIAALDQRHGKDAGDLLAETARELALGMAYEDTVRVAELKIRPSRFERVRAEVQAADGQIVEIAEFLHPRVQEIADTLPAALGRSASNDRTGRAALRRAHVAQGGGW